MYKCQPRKMTEVPPCGSGASCSLLVTQGTGDPGGWDIDLFAQFDVDGTRHVFLVKTVTIAAAAGRNPNRVAAVATCPGAIEWSAVVRPPAGATKPLQVGIAVSEMTAFGLANVSP